ncbi:hypothetical protein GCM10017620_09090 [Brevundimonas intermedia]|uniref:DUF2975 domain-containing protein n=1 Tax=Brevundimonas intermedia TaxID=74315 RepID=A0ABQ5T840_9CAUL|nr:hypothetical protein [Brevundimonas intermedia]GLK47936.1 hypothetical protein GCM10017620_09090 [Brevundimonas intermedia]
MRLNIALPALGLTAFWTCAAAAQSVEPGGRGLKIAAVFNDAGPETKLIVLGLVACGLAAALLAPRLARQTRDNPSPRGIGFISGLRLGGPLIALVAVLHNLLNWAVASAWFNRSPSHLQLAQGYAELALIALAGTVAATFAIFSLEHVRAAEQRARG